MCSVGLLKKNRELHPLHQFVSTSPEETLRHGSVIAPLLKPNSILALIGDLGAGKTTLIKGLVQALFPSFLPEEIQSPTFTYLHVLETNPPIYHFDLYRIQSQQEFLAMGFDEYFFQSGICLIEWAECILPLLPFASLVLEILHVDQESRKLSLFSV